MDTLLTDSKIVFVFIAINLDHCIHIFDSGNILLLPTICLCLLKTKTTKSNKVLILKSYVLEVT